jgi:1,4-alpha-glucan branching enzyme
MMMQCIAGRVCILFTYTGKAESVCLRGDFNGWSAGADCLERSGDKWTIRLALSPGRYKYAFVLDGRRWMPDPNAFLYEDDGFGTKNSVLIVE